jgi:hypothetical protein
MLTTGEIASAVGRGMTRRKIERLVAEEAIPYFRLGSGWVQIPSWVADAIISRMDEQLRLRDQLGRLLAQDDSPEVVTRRDAIRAQLKDLSGPITHPEDPPETPTSW